MKHGRFICDTLKAIRLDIARANGIEYTPVKCNHKGECAGTCPACESEMRFLEREIARKRSLGKAALVAGVSLAMSSLSAMAGNSALSEAMMSSYRNSCHMCDTTKRVEIFGSVEQMPQFRGGERALIKYLQENVVYPPEAAKNKIQGRVVVQFIVDPSGCVGEVKVVRSVHELLDEEAVRVVKTLPKFYPGRILGKAVSVRYTLPITFTLTDDGKNTINSVEVSPPLPSDIESDEEQCFEEPDVLPEFPGGLDSLMNYLSEHIRYPKMAAKNKVQGRVLVRFVVQKTGKVGHVEVLESVDKDLAEEAVRVVKSLPDFTPGLVNDKPVNVWFTLPVNFKFPE